MNDSTIALEENLWSLWSHFGRGPECSLIDENGIIRFDTPIPTLPYNAAVKFEKSEKEVDQSLDEIFNHYRQRNVEFFSMMPTVMVFWTDLAVSCPTVKLPVLRGHL
jgi:hypothetical protein